ncbi:MAG TPA: TlpA disulfide reductase family protein [Propionibacteriaceae bacterium]|nr:TlpA disulfide reductase family protein [Propionibacteriaceae bacterium]
MVIRRLLVAALAVVLLTSCSGLLGQGTTDVDAGFAQGDGSYTRISPDKRVLAPVLTGTDLEGKPLSTADFDGLVVIINVWGSWCEPCRHEVPELVKAAEQRADVAQIVGINTRDVSADTALAFTRHNGVTFPSFFDPDGALLLTFTALPPRAIPSTVVIDQQGRVAARILGEANASTLVGTIDDLVAGR